MSKIHQNFSPNEALDENPQKGKFIFNRPMEKTQKETFKIDLLSKSNKDFIVYGPYEKTLQNFILNGLLSKKPTKFVCSMDLLRKYQTNFYF